MHKIEYANLVQVLCVLLHHFSTHTSSFIMLGMTR